MAAFEELLRQYMDRMGIKSIEELAERFAVVPRREEDPPLKAGELRKMLRGEADVHPTFFRYLRESLRLTEDEYVQLGRAYFDLEPSPSVIRESLSSQG